MIGIDERTLTAPSSPEAAEETTGVAGDAVERLLAASRRYPLLTPDEEIELAKRIERGDLAAKDRMVNSNIRLVVSNARRYQNHGLPLADLVQEGMLGLIRAAEKFDWRKGFRFSTYATLWIRQAIQRGLENSGRTIRLPVHVGQRARRLARTEKELAAALGREPTDEELAEAARLPVAEIDVLRQAQQTPTSLDLEIGDEGDTSLGALIASDEEPPEETAARRERAETVRAAIDALPEPERNVIALRFGTGGEEPHSLAQASRRLGISPEGARRAEERALRALARVPELAGLREAA